MQPPPPPPPKTKVTIVGKNEIYHWTKLVGPFVVHNLLGPDTHPHSNTFLTPPPHTHKCSIPSSKGEHVRTPKLPAGVLFQHSPPAPPMLPAFSCRPV